VLHAVEQRRVRTGTVLLEAIVAGLPVLTTAVCGYASHVVAAEAGVVVGEPFRQADLNAALAAMLADAPARARWSAAGLAYAERADIYSNAERAADIILRAPR
jgi:UDP-glucose:(heptosyl)LPS alpha-1,3-glucosyltransferase